MFCTYHEDGTSATTHNELHCSQANPRVMGSVCRFLNVKGTNYLVSEGVAISVSSTDLGVYAVEFYCIPATRVGSMHEQESCCGSNERGDVPATPLGPLRTTSLPATPDRTLREPTCASQGPLALLCTY